MWMDPKDRELVRRGYARHYRTFTYARKREFRDLEERASRNKQGLWAIAPLP